MRSRRGRFSGALAAFALVAAGSVFVIGMGPASAAPVPPPLGQTNNTNVGPNGCANGGNPYFDPNGAVAGDLEFFGPVAVAVSPVDGKVWVQDFRKSLSAGAVGRLIGWASVAAAENCTAPTFFGPAQFNQPEGLAFDAAGNMFMTETGNNSIWKWSPAAQTAGPTKANGTVVAHCWGGANVDDCVVAANQLRFPRGMAVGPDNLLYVADDDNARILAFNVTGGNNNATPVTIISTPGCEPKAVWFVGAKLFFANFTACGQGPVGVHRLNGTAAASTTEASAALPGAIDLGSSGTTLFATSVNGSLTSFANADTGTLNNGVNKTSVTLNGFTGSYALHAPLFGIANAGNGTMLLADSGAFRVLKFSTVPEADLGITKSHAGNFTQGQSGSYSLVVTNSGPAAATQPITVTDTLPAGLTFVSAGSGGDQFACTANAQVVTCTRTTDLANAGTATITIPVAVSATAPANVTNQASVAAANNTNAANDTASDPTIITQTGGGGTTADLSVDATGGSFVVGQQGTLNLHIANAGPAATSQGTVIVTLNLPTGVTFVSGSGTGFVCSAAGATVTCTRTAPLAAGSAVDLAVVLAVGPTAVTGSVITITVADPNVPDPNPANNGTSVVITVTPATGTGTFTTSGTTFDPFGFGFNPFGGAFNPLGAGFNPLGFLGSTPFGLNGLGLPGVAPAAGGQQQEQQQQQSVAVAPAAAPAAAAPAASGRVPFTGRPTRALTLFAVTLFVLGIAISVVADLAPKRR